jgi:hypothetical protein
MNGSACQAFDPCAAAVAVDGEAPRVANDLAATFSIPCFSVLALGPLPFICKLDIARRRVETQGIKPPISGRAAFLDYDTRGCLGFGVHDITRDVA